MKGKILTIVSLMIISMNATANQDLEFTKSAHDYLFNSYFKFNPSLATQNGVHIYDDQLESYSPSAIKKQIADLNHYAKTFSEYKASELSEKDAADEQIILNRIYSQLLDLQTIRPWQINPDFYSSTVTNSIFVIMQRDYAGLTERLKNVIARENLIPTVLQTAQGNLKNPAKISTEIALEQLPDVIKFFQQDVPQAFAQVKDNQLQSQFAQSNAKVIAALQQYQAWLKTKVLPNAKGDFRLGANTLYKKLQYDEMVDLPLDKLLAIGVADLHKNQAALIAISKQLYPSISAHDALEKLGSNHPKPNELITVFKNSMDKLVTFINEKSLLTIPENDRPIVEETPPFERATTFASLDSTGPFEKTPAAYFYVTLPAATWSKDETESYMQSFIQPTIESTAIHEVFPGHYLQFLWLNQNKDVIRTVLYANSNVEGWAHYTEQMMVDEGYGNTDPHAEQILRLGQLRDALLRDARFIVAIKLHTGQMTYDQAVKFFETQGYQTHMTGVMESKRATSDPTYLYYTLGKLQILKLRADMQKREGKAFNLRKFHDEFLAQGGAPIKIIRQTLLHDNSATL